MPDARCLLESSRECSGVKPKNSLSQHTTNKGGELLFVRLVNSLLGENRLERLINAMEGEIDYEFD